MIQTAIENPYATSTPKKLSKEKKSQRNGGKKYITAFHDKKRWNDSSQYRKLSKSVPMRAHRYASVMGK